MSASLSRDIRNKNVRWNSKYNSVIDFLVHGKLGDEGAAKIPNVFTYNKDLIVFAAMVGKSLDVKEEVEKENNGIALLTFEGAAGTRSNSVDQHNIIFMFGLSVLRDMKYLRDESVDDIINVFEQYSNGGLGVIQQWLRESAWDPLVLLDKIIDQLKSDGDNQDFVNPF